MTLGEIVAVFITVLVFTGFGVVVAPALAPLLVFVAGLDIAGLGAVAGLAVVKAVAERLGIW